MTQLSNLRSVAFAATLTINFHLLVFVTINQKSLYNLRHFVVL
jgi:hypothetical protein